MATFNPGAVWNDTDGHPIQAHGGGILRDGDTYYWYGENKNAPNVPGKHRVDVVGVSCYSSRDFVHWKNEGVVLPAVPGDESHDLHPRNVLERPKALRSPSTGKYVLWTHVDSPDYTKASVGVAVADNATGPFEYRASFQPDGQPSRDMTVWQDSDGAAYLFFSADGVVAGSTDGKVSRNATLRVARLTDDFLGLAGPSAEALPGLKREAPAVWRWRDRYYMVTSGCTGWRANPAQWHVADELLGLWETGGDPVDGTPEQQATTFDSQSTYVLPHPGGNPDRFVFLADRWNPENLQDSRYVWLPLSMTKDGVPRIEWRDSWSIANEG